MEAIAQDRHTGSRGTLEHYHGIKWDDPNLRRLTAVCQAFESHTRGDLSSMI